MAWIEDARRLWPRLWSVRLAMLSALLSACEFALPYFAPSIPDRWFAGLAFMVALAAALARVIAQPKLHHEQAHPDRAE